MWFPMIQLLRDVVYVRRRRAADVCRDAVGDDTEETVDGGRPRPTADDVAAVPRLATQFI